MKEVLGLLTMLYTSLMYVKDQHMFWGSMGFTTSIAMFIGVLLYDGNTKEVNKGFITIFSYASMLLWTTSIRIIPNAFERNFNYADGRPFATIATIFYLTIFWVLGIQVGVRLFKHKHYKLQ